MKRILVVLVMLSATAQAATHRLAVLVGANTGADGVEVLRYAQADADKLARVLVELGGFATDDVMVLHGPSRALVEQTLAAATLRVQTWHALAGERVVLLFYFSGHSDGVAFELGRERYDYIALRRWLADSGADVRVAIADTCKAGALIAAKGGKPGPAFDLRITDDLATHGEALLVSSAANEVALESSDLGGSFFTHHLVSGLRGAADASGDGVVTLGEAYQYAFTHTLSGTAETLSGPQHPSYDYRLSGQGDMVLTEVRAPSAVLELPSGYSRVLVADAHEVVAEIDGDGARRLALAPGVYTVRVWGNGEALTARITLAASEERHVQEGDLVPAAGQPGVVKGASPERTGGLDLALSAGWTAFGGHDGSAYSDDPVPTWLALVARVRRSGASGWSLGASFVHGIDRAYVSQMSDALSDISTTQALASAGWRFGFGDRHVRGWLELEADVGLIAESAPGYSHTGIMIGGCPTLGLALRIAGPAWLSAEAGLPVLFGRDRGFPLELRALLGLIIEL